MFTVRWGVGNCAQCQEQGSFCLLVQTLRDMEISYYCYEGGYEMSNEQVELMLAQVNFALPQKLPVNLNSTGVAIDTPAKIPLALNDVFLAVLHALTVGLNEHSAEDFKEIRREAAEVLHLLADQLYYRGSMHGREKAADNFLKSFRSS